MLFLQYTVPHNRRKLNDRVQTSDRHQSGKFRYRTLCICVTILFISENLPHKASISQWHICSHVLKDSMESLSFLTVSSQSLKSHHRVWCAASSTFFPLVKRSFFVKFHVVLHHCEIDLVKRCTQKHSHARARTHTNALQQLPMGCICDSGLIVTRLNKSCKKSFWSERSFLVYLCATSQTVPRIKWNNSRRYSWCFPLKHMWRQTVENVKTLLTSFLTGFEKKKSFLHLACCSFILLCCAVLLHRPTHCFLVLVWVRAVLISNFPINVTAMAKKRIVTKATKKNIISNCKRLQIALLMIGNQSSSYLGFLFIMKNLVHTT